MIQTDCQFPLIQYDPKGNPSQWGEQHGESFRAPIGELSAIRRQLMLTKNPRLKHSLSSLAQEQMATSQSFSPKLFEEMEGIARGANLTLEDLVILNNYTDFRDLEMPDEGCSTLSFRSPQGHISGQTWDMHQSAQNYVCLIQYPLTLGGEEHEGIVFSLVGCLGMMGINTQKIFAGVNNLNTLNARAALIWPFLVRQLLTTSQISSMREMLKAAPVTSGHNYLIADPHGGEHWELTPTHCKKVADDKEGAAFHTNHCLAEQLQGEENKKALSLSTKPRYQILKEQAPLLKTKEDLTALLKSHKNYPLSICTHPHPDSPGQDPSVTCGGGVFHHEHTTLHLWRGCPRENTNYRSFDFKIEGNRFREIPCP